MVERVKSVCAHVISSCRWCLSEGWDAQYISVCQTNAHRDAQRCQLAIAWLGKMLTLSAFERDASCARRASTESMLSSPQAAYKGVSPFCARSTRAHTIRRTLGRPCLSAHDMQSSMRACSSILAHSICHGALLLLALQSTCFECTCWQLLVAGSASFRTSRSSYSR